MSTRPAVVCGWLVLELVLSPARADDLNVGPLVRVTGASPFGNLAACGSDPGVDPNQPGEEGRNFTGIEVEPWVVANPTRRSNLVALWQQDRWSNGGARSNVAGVSFDRGQSWQIVVVPGLTECSGGPFERASDPWLDFSPDGTLHQMSLLVDISSDPESPFGTERNGMAVSRSFDGGGSWEKPLLLIDESDPTALNDKNALTADPHSSKRVYAVWDRLDVTPGGRCEELGGLVGPIVFTRSIDGGRSYERPRPIYDPGCFNQTLANQIVVLPDGTLVNLFNEILNVTSLEPMTTNPEPYSLALLRSFDHGETWESRPTRVEALSPVGVHTPDTGEPVRDAAILSDVAVNSNHGTLYAVWQDARFLQPELTIDQIAFSVSEDGGVTWSEPIRINRTPATPENPLRQQAFIPSVEVTRSGTVAVTYYDFRYDEDGMHELADYFMVVCERQCTDPQRFVEVRLTERSFDYSEAAETGAGLFLGDYMALEASSRDFHALFGQAFRREDADGFFRRVKTGR